jgi:hypothetical protein
VFANFHNQPLYAPVGKTIARHGGWGETYDDADSLRRWPGTGKVKAWNACVLKSSI